jgi:hypothetical protein
MLSTTTLGKVCNPIAICLGRCGENLEAPGKMPNEASLRIGVI